MAAEVPVNAKKIISKQVYYGGGVFNTYVPVIVSASLGKVYPQIAWGSNSGEMWAKPVDDNLMPKNRFNNIRQFIQLERSFLQQLEKFPELFDGLNRYLLQEKMKLSADSILNCMPDKISLEVTLDGSIFYTFLKDDLNVYFEHYLIDEFDDSDESIISIFKGDENILNFGGSLVDTLTELNNFLAPRLTATLELV
jgi:hypothetical protein